VTITVDDKDFIDLALGKANAPSVCWLEIDFNNYWYSVYFTAFC
jgi:hypothetical protein